MRRPIKPFAVEVRRSSRKTPASGPMDPLDEIAPLPEADAGASRRPAEESDQGYLAALRAADALFGGSTPRSAPPPKSETRPAWPSPEADRQAQPRNAAALAAEEMFRPAPRTQGPADAPQTSTDAPAGTGRILQSLNERDPLQQRLADEELADRDAGPREPRQRDPFRSRSSEVRRLPIPVQDAPATQADGPRDEQPVGAPGKRARLPGYVRGSIYARWVTGEAARPGENWRKRRTKSVT